MRIGPHQLRLLVVLGSPTMTLMAGDKVSASLVRRGLLREDRYGGAVITPAGLRALADELAAGRVAEVLKAIKRDAVRRRKRGRS